MDKKIKEYLMEYFESVYCDNCNSECCDECDRKSMNWGLSENAAEIISKKILGMIEFDK